MKFGQDITREICFSKNHAEIEVGRLVSHLSFVLKKFISGKSKCSVVCSLVSTYLDSPQLGIQ